MQSRVIRYGDIEKVFELVRLEGVTSAVDVCGRLSIKPDLVEEVASVISTTL